MIIRIEDEPIQYSIESERNLGEVIDYLSRWLGESGFAITTVKRDKKDVPINGEQSWRTVSLDEVAELDVGIKLRREIAVERLGTVLEFLATLLAQSKQEGAVFHNLLSGSQDLSSVIDTQLVAMPGEVGTPGSRYRELVSNYTSADGQTRADAKMALTEYVTLLVGRIKESMKEIGDPLSQARQVALSLSESLHEIENVSVLLQTGRDRDAMRVVERFTAQSQRLVRLVSLIVEHRVLSPDAFSAELGDLYEFERSFNSVLSELSDALTIGDSVLTADLLEYEIAPRVGKLAAAVSRTG